MIRLQRHADRTARAAGEADQPLGKPRDPVERGVDRVAWSVLQIGAADETHEIAVAGLVGGDKHQWEQFGTLPFLIAAVGILVLVVEGDVDLAADQRLDAVLDRVLRELESAKEVVGIGDRNRRHRILHRMRDDLLHRQRAFEQRIG